MFYKSAIVSCFTKSEKGGTKRDYKANEFSRPVLFELREIDKQLVMVVSLPTAKTDKETKAVTLNKSRSFAMPLGSNDPTKAVASLAKAITNESLKTFRYSRTSSAVIGNKRIILKYNRGDMKTSLTADQSLTSIDLDDFNKAVKDLQSTDWIELFTAYRAENAQQYDSFDLASFSS